ncbi:MAG: Mrp/NBP35 family ATP-binding protein [Clostridium sp.]|jgi:Mrp family chromosome partitioning ATPase|uniref:Mrp/NBP35 family ATP-binding protein n=1 Tax=Clostridium sp. TaxID=1506 RepID=UPI0025C15032|nr:Mrp/NBP35 family ATP-binding protein [Clostridium sp.]MCH3965350.1 Mrp/NBP35 family ATP-binding protein [Clostridium sp.]MCI1714571.1 Mrp/NBP35 family ATP-binding protein [Clostridium sp.]MCI1798833.1 Mrp/NBP35 family ATP-binding protein [Clostridium sp.]MCI1812436.1 Mrp/NBP35 family ATP-binding protein [Clostridium sp.]MCI1869643.1 Mrp/NBP35 family ATP-binding protein [Clostridium sp.]
MSNCSDCPGNSNCNVDNKNKCSKLVTKFGHIKHIIGIMSGKGGVGKSTITGSLAIKLTYKGYKVGVLDGDITGPSMPRFFGINKDRAKITAINNSQDVKFSTVNTPLGIEVMSLNLLTEKEEQPVIWRGPVITGVLTQMYSDTEWGDLDYLLIDMPPGTGDVALTIMQDIPLEGIVIVSTPQDMVSMIVKKVVIMAEKMNINIIGAVENMSYVKCKNCNEKIRLFSKKSADEQAAYLGLPLLDEIPMDLELVDKMEDGKVEEYISKSPDYNTLVDNFMSRLKL